MQVPLLVDMPMQFFLGLQFHHYFLPSLRGLVGGVVLYGGVPLSWGPVLDGLTSSEWSARPSWMTSSAVTRNFLCRVQTCHEQVLPELDRSR
jgi:hypothetical protein